MNQQPEPTTPITDAAWAATSDGRGHSTITRRADRDLVLRRAPCSGTWRFLSTETELPVTAGRVRELADLMDTADANAWGDTCPSGDPEPLAASGSDR